MTAIEGLKISKADIDKYGDKAVIISDNGYREIDDNGEKKKILSLTIEVQGRRRDWTPNKTSINNLVANPNFGDDAEQWVGKMIRFEVEKMRAFGKEQDVLIAYPGEETVESPSSDGVGRQ